MCFKEGSKEERIFEFFIIKENKVKNDVFVSATTHTQSLIAENVKTNKRKQLIISFNVKAKKTKIFIY